MEVEILESMSSSGTRGLFVRFFCGGESSVGKKCTGSGIPSARVGFRGLGDLPDCGCVVSSKLRGDSLNVLGEDFGDVRGDVCGEPARDRGDGRAFGLGDDSPADDRVCGGDD